MRKTMVTTLVALAVSATGLASQAPASAQMSGAVSASAQEEVLLTYAEPVREGQERITWRWTISNDGQAVDEVVVTHRVSPVMPVSFSAPCEGTAEKITCKLGELKAGESWEGEIVAEVPEGQSGTAEIRGTVTWKEGSAAEPVA
ncbi:hypothetical protein ACF059_31070 [Streptomyces sp. NPDC016562]|uniref:hypothetical protein n=1 Tax=Streptomyces sp. NPDC016562 TaxID=3364966 RepID=UPI0036FAC623